MIPDSHRPQTGEQPHKLIRRNVLEHLVRAGTVDLLVSIGDVVRRVVGDAKTFQMVPAFQRDMTGEDLPRRMLDQVKPRQTVDVRGYNLRDPEPA